MTLHLVAVTYLYKSIKTAPHAVAAFLSADAAESYKNDLECEFERMGIEEDVVVNLTKTDLVC